MKRNLKRRVLMLGVLLLAITAPALTYAAYSSRLPNDEMAAAPIAMRASTEDDRGAPRIPEEAAMVMAGMALIGAAAVVRRAA